MVKNETASEKRREVIMFETIKANGDTTYRPDFAGPTTQ